MFETKYRRPWIFQTLNSGSSNNLSLQYQRFKPSSIYIGIRKLKVVGNTPFLNHLINYYLKDNISRSSNVGM